MLEKYEYKPYKEPDPYQTVQSYYEGLNEHLQNEFKRFIEICKEELNERS